MKALPYFDVNAETTLQMDASKKGLAVCLIQKGKSYVMLPELLQRLNRITRIWTERHLELLGNGKVLLLPVWKGIHIGN